MWPPAALDFLRELEDNNDRDWFKANRGRYDELLLDPARALADELGGLGPAHFFRPYNNTRFRPGPPLKEHIAASVGSGPAVYYFQLSLDGLVLGAGLWHPETDQLERFRATIDDVRRAGQFERAVSTARGRRPVLGGTRAEASAEGLLADSPADRAAAPEASGALPPPPAATLAPYPRVRPAGALPARVGASASSPGSTSTWVRPRDSGLAEPRLESTRRARSSAG